MPPDAEHEAFRAIGLWRELGRAYDDIEACLAAQAWDELTEIAARIAVVEHALEGLGGMGVRAADGAACTPAAAAAWREADQLAQALAARLPAIERAARTARDAAAAHLARVRVTRERTSTYRPATKVAPRFTSRVA